VEKGEAAEIIGAFAGGFVRSLFSRDDGNWLGWLTSPIGLLGLAILGAVAGFARNWAKRNHDRRWAYVVGGAALLPLAAALAVLHLGAAGAMLLLAALAALLG
jgi:hypothetical protein